MEIGDWQVDLGKKIWYNSCLSNKKKERERERETERMVFKEMGLTQFSDKGTND